MLAWRLLEPGLLDRTFDANALGIDPHPSQGTKRHQTRDGSVATGEGTAGSC
jgi:hypothetical protein